MTKNQNMKFKLLKTLEKTNFGDKFSVDKVLVEAPNGEHVEFFLRSGNDFALVIPLISATEVIMVEQPRLSVENLSLEFPMGQVANPEGRQLSGEEIAAIELKEETGYTAGKLTLLGSFYPASGWNKQRALVYVAEDLVAGQAEPEPLEFITVKKVGLEELERKVVSNEITDLPTIAAFGLTKLYLQKRSKA